MEDEIKVIWRMIAYIIISLSFVISSCTMHENHVISEMVKNGASPIEAGCSVFKGETTPAMCVIAAQGKEVSNESK